MAKRMDNLGSVVRLRITDEDHREAIQKAASLGMNLSQYVRFLLKTYEPKVNQ